MILPANGWELICKHLLTVAEKRVYAVAHKTSRVLIGDVDVGRQYLGF